MGRPVAVLIAGPTASGKSALALELAEALGGTIINADSCQVYRDLRIISARPSAEEEAKVPHRLYGMRPAADPSSVADWLADAAAALAETFAAGRVPVVVGGTGLYLQALTEGLARVPAIPEAIRQFWRERALTHGAEALHADLMRRDPLMAERLRPSDAQRIARALEVIEATGRSLADWQADPPSTPVLEAARCLRLVIEPERSVLHQRIDRRFHLMIEAGALAML